MDKTAVSIVLCLLVVQVATFDTVAADQPAQPQLRASIISPDNACRFVNETALPTLLFHFECSLGVDVNATDRSNPEVSYLWIDHDLGGSFNSTRSQWIQYRSPQGIECFSLNVTVSAVGYESASDEFRLIDMTIPSPSGGYVHNCPYPPWPVPEFPSMSLTLVVSLIFAVLLFARKKRGNGELMEARLIGESVGTRG